MEKLKCLALACALTTGAAGSAIAQSTKTNAWEGFYGQVSVGFAAFNPKIGSTTIAPVGQLSGYSNPPPYGLGQTVSVATSAVH